MTANAFKVLFFLLPLLATQWALNEKKVSRCTPSNFGLRTSGSSASEILIFGWVLACIGSGVNKVTVDFGADINNNRTSLSGNRSGIFTPEAHMHMSSA